MLGLIGSLMHTISGTGLLLGSIRQYQISLDVVGLIK